MWVHRSILLIKYLDVKTINGDRNGLTVDLERDLRNNVVILYIGMHKSEEMRAHA